MLLGAHDSFASDDGNGLNAIRGWTESMRRSIYIKRTNIFKCLPLIIWSFEKLSPEERRWMNGVLFDKRPSQRLFAFARISNTITSIYGN